ncbi:hypothetical protein GALMADRAFT_143980 [Galerina marginata CBS 339.88]|uniref:Uncharacterized protein n=1 Tax=Galerina marginata (strain CBS 339.88) TaxID=685588 RepID=A0A067SU91_GALM3|nr:hypothetical protein GALMADRAFT_143980 [Galerina marginata CBS 339.88]
MHSLSLLTFMFLTIVFLTRALPISLDHQAYATGVVAIPSEDAFPHAWYKPEEPASSTGISEEYSTIRSSRSYDPQGSGPDWRRKRTTP